LGSVTCCTGHAWPLERSTGAFVPNLAPTITSAGVICLCSAGITHHCRNRQRVADFGRSPDRTRAPRAPSRSLPAAAWTIQQGAPRFPPRPGPDRDVPSDAHLLRQAGGGGSSLAHLLRRTGAENVEIKAHVRLPEIGEYQRTHLLSMIDSMRDLILASTRIEEN